MNPTKNNVKIQFFRGSKSNFVLAAATTALLLIMASSGWAADQKATTGLTPPREQNMPKNVPEELIDINTATKAQLMTLAGVAETTAQRIIKKRPYAKKDQLKSLKILTQQEYDRIKDKIIAKQPRNK